MLSKFGVHHFIFALLPILLLFQENVHEIPINDIFIPLIFSFIIVFILWIILARFVKERKSSMIISFSIILFIIFAYVRSGLLVDGSIESQFFAKNVILMPILLSILIIGIVYIIRKTISSNITSIINTASIAIICFMIIHVGVFYAENQNSLEETRELLNVPLFQITETKQPNVYFLVLDAYSGNDRLEDGFGYDNSKFYKQLEEREFYVQKTSFSNYANTEFSVPSMLNMQYFDFVSELKGKKYKNVLLLQELSKDNLVSEVFRANGYDIYSLGENTYTRFHYSTNLCRNDFNLNQDLLNNFYYMFVPVSSIRNALLWNTDHYQFIMCAIDTMKNFENKSDKPFFMYTHVMLPHTPFIFDAQGSEIKRVDTYATDSNLIEYKDAYIEQVKFANKFTIDIVDSIQQKDPGAVIIVMSDHGDRLGINWIDPTIIDYYSGLNNLSAIYFPGEKSHFSTTITPVNLFRIFFNSYFETDYDILNDRLFWYENSQPFVHYDITEKINLNSTQN